jgi:hypothetical protein
VFLFSLLLACSGKNVRETDCGDSVDNDSDGVTDCEDEDCSSSCLTGEPDTDTDTDTEDTEVPDDDVGLAYEATGLWVDESPSQVDACGVEGMIRPVEIFVHVLNVNGLEVEVVSEGLGEDVEEDVEEIGPVLQCTWGEGTSYFCAEIEYIWAHISELNPDAPSSLDADIGYYVLLNATFLETENMSGELLSRMECFGTDCSSVSAELGTTFPCSIQRNFNAILTNEE